MSRWRQTCALERGRESRGMTVGLFLWCGPARLARTFARKIRNKSAFKPRRDSRHVTRPRYIVTCASSDSPAILPRTPLSNLIYRSSSYFFFLSFFFLLSRPSVSASSYFSFFFFPTTRLSPSLGVLTPVSIGS